MKKAYLVLADNTVFEGTAFGAEWECMGEAVFLTSVVGYIETLSDPAYAGQIVVQTFPQIGNYGMIEADLQGKCRPAGYVVREWCAAPSNFRAEGDIDAFLRREGVVGICGVDTRALTRHLRENGSMNAMITDRIPGDPAALRTYAASDPLARTGRTEAEIFAAAGAEKYRVTLVDYGCGASLVRPLTERGCTVTAVPYTASAETILARNPDGVLLSGGAGDPAEYPSLTGTAAALAGRVPLFGVGLGHQLLALAMGAKSAKMHCGHHGGNYPVRDTQGSRTYITEQNHLYTILPESVTAGTVRYVNVNDGSCEGIDYPDRRAFSVQFHPVLSSASRDTEILFDRFIHLMGGAF